MVTVSICMIVRNEEEVLARCLESASRLADELIVVDTGSQDRTREIALGYTPLVYDFPWVDDFSAARNFSFSKASCQYCMWLDADDVLEPEDLAEFLRLKQQLNPAVDVVMAPYHTAFDEDGTPTFTYHRERWLRRESGFVWEGPVHEAITPKGRVEYTTAAVRHRKLRVQDPQRNLRILEGLLRRGQPLEPRQLYYYARELYYHHRCPEAIAQLQQYLDTPGGWEGDRLEACRLLGDCLDRQNRPQEALQAFLRGLQYTPPQSELCCDLGRHFMELGQYRQAIAWYRLAPECLEQGVFHSPDCRGYLPYLQLCVCHHRLGENQIAEEYNQKALALKPSCPICLRNQQYFRSLGQGLPT